jgi:hypothetical protein
MQAEVNAGCQPPRIQLLHVFDKNIVTCKMQEEEFNRLIKTIPTNLPVHTARPTDSATCAGSRCSLFACSANPAAVFQ